MSSPEQRECSAPPGHGGAQGAAEEGEGGGSTAAHSDAGPLGDAGAEPLLLTDLPDHIIAAAWPFDRVVDGIGVCCKGLTRALLTSRVLALRGRRLGGGLAGFLEPMSELRELFIASSELGDEGVAALAQAVGSLTALQRLWLHDAAITASGAEPLGRLLPPGLLRLALVSDSLGAEGAGALGRHFPSRLTELNLACTELGPAGMKVLGPLLPPNLISLDLMGNRLGADGAKALGECLRSALKILELGHNDLGAAGARALAPHLSDVRYLDLTGNRFGVEGVEALAPHLPSELTYLNLSSNNLSCAKVLVRHLPSLTALDLTMNRLEGEGEAALRPHLPPGLQFFKLGDLDFSGSNLHASVTAKERILPKLQRLGLG